MSSWKGPSFSESGLPRSLLFLTSFRAFGSVPILKPSEGQEGMAGSHLHPQVTDLLVDESSFTGEVEPCSKTDSPLLGGGDLSTLSNVVFMGTLVQCGKGQVSKAPGPASAAAGLVLPPSLLHTGSCDRHRRPVSVRRSVQDDAS